MIRANNLEKFYNKKKANEVHVLKNINLELEDKGLVFICGESGSGKTTLMNVVSGLDSCDNGSVLVDGNELGKAGKKDFEEFRLKKCGYVFQKYLLLEDETVAENIRLVTNMYDTPEEKKEERIDYVLNAVGMLRYKKRQVSQLSGGQQQRIAIARALVKSPEIIFADELTGNLDEENTIQIMGILKQISKDSLVVVISHERRIAEFFGDRIIEIRDGILVKDTYVDKNTCYSRMDDNNLYLGNYKEYTAENPCAVVKTYGSPEKPLHIRVVYENGTYFIDTPDSDSVRFLDKESAIQIREGNPPQLNEKEAVHSHYMLEPIHGVIHAKLPAKELFSRSLKGVKNLGRKQFFLVLSFIATAVFLVLTLSDIMTIMHIDPEDIVNCDSRIIQLNVEKNSTITAAQLTETYLDIYNAVMDSGLNVSPCLTVSPQITYHYQGFEQLEQYSAVMDGFTFIQNDFVDESTLIAGNMPEDQYDLVIDRWVLEEFLEENPTMKATVNDVTSFVGKTVSISKKPMEFTICGITDCGEPDVFIDPYAYMSIGSWTDKVTCLSRLQALYPGKYADVELEADEVLVAGTSTDVRNSIYHTRYGVDYRVAGIVEDNFDAVYVIADEYYDELICNMCIYAKRMSFFSADDKQELKTYLKSGLEDEIYDTVQVVVTDPYAVKMEIYENQKQLKADARLIITITICIVSLFILYFSMSASVSSKRKEIVVFRLLGIKKSSIALMFVLENLMISCYTTLPGILITTAVLKLLSKSPSLGINAILPWYSVAALAVAVFSVNLIVGLIPVVTVLRKSPARLEEL